MHLHGIHHVTAVTAHAPRNFDFYTRVLGLRLVKKSVNQDDVSAYHLFYADGVASPGTDFTFFDWPVPSERRGTRSIVRTGLRVNSEASLVWWRAWLLEKAIAVSEIKERGGWMSFDFEDFEGQRMRLVADPTEQEDHSWARSPVPTEHQIRGLGPMVLSVPVLKPTEQFLTSIMNLTPSRVYRENASHGSGEVNVHVFQMPSGRGASGELHVAVEPQLPPARQGAGSVHHLAFRTPNNEDYESWLERLQEFGVSSSGAVDRYYFRSLYFREPNGILFEIATDGPGFAVDEPLETLGERLALPPFLEGRRVEIESGLRPLQGGDDRS